MIGNLKLPVMSATLPLRMSALNTDEDDCSAMAEYNCVLAWVLEAENKRSETGPPQTAR